MDGQKWFKFYGQDWLTDMKMMRLGVEDRLCFITLLCLASASSEQGVIHCYDEESIIHLTHLRENPLDDENCEYRRAIGFVQRFVAMGIITIRNGEDIVINAFNKRQNSNLSSTERSRKSRGSFNATTHRVAKQQSTALQRDARVEESRVEKSREEESKEEREVAAPAEPTPADDMRDFLASGQKYQKALLALIGNGVPRDVAERELKKFASYWSELNKSGKKMKWELQKTFEVNRRLATWFGNIERRYGGVQSQKVGKRYD